MATGATGTNQAFPQIYSPFVDQRGIIQQAWLQLLISLWVRTGSGVGSLEVGGDLSGFLPNPEVVRLHLLTPLAVEQGGTETNVLTQRAVLIGNNVGPVHFASPGATGTVLTSNGPSADPSFQAGVTGPAGATGPSGGPTGATGPVGVAPTGPTGPSINGLTLPTVDPGVTGALWNSGGFVKVSKIP